MTKARIAAILTTLGLSLLLLTATGCDRGLDNQITDTVLFALRIAGIWV